jgi:hypothetical protein
MAGSISPTDKSVYPKAKMFALIAIAVMAIALIVGGWWVLTQWNPKSTPNLNIIMDNENFTVPTESYVQRNFTVPPNLTFTELEGFFSVQADGAQTIRVYVMDAQNFAEWQNGRNNTRYYDSGELNTGNFTFYLVTDKTYFIVFDNAYSATPKNVNASVFFYYRID